MTSKTPESSQFSFCCRFPDCIVNLVVIPGYTDGRQKKVVWLPGLAGTPETKVLTRDRQDMARKLRQQVFDYNCCLFNYPKLFYCLINIDSLSVLKISLWWFYFLTSIVELSCQKVYTYVRTTFRGKCRVHSTPPSNTSAQTFSSFLSRNLSG